MKISFCSISGCGQRASVEVFRLQSWVRFLLLPSLPPHASPQVEALPLQALQLRQCQEGQLVRPLRKHSQDQGRIRRGHDRDWPRPVSRSFFDISLKGTRAKIITKLDQLKHIIIIVKLQFLSARTENSWNSWFLLKTSRKTQIFPTTPVNLRRNSIFKTQPKPQPKPQPIIGKLKEFFWKRLLQLEFLL